MHAHSHIAHIVEAIGSNVEFVELVVDFAIVEVFFFSLLQVVFVEQSALLHVEYRRPYDGVGSHIAHHKIAFGNKNRLAVGRNGGFEPGSAEQRC